MVPCRDDAVLANALCVVVLQSEDYLKQTLLADISLSFFFVEDVLEPG